MKWNAKELLACAMQHQIIRLLVAFYVDMYLKKRWMDYVTNDMLEKGVDDAMMANIGEWKKMTCCADPK